MGCTSLNLYPGWLNLLLSKCKCTAKACVSVKLLNWCKALRDWRDHFIKSAAFAGWQGPLSPCGSTVSAISCGAAPTIPSAPLSPADSELFDESRLFSRDFGARSDASTPVPSSADAALCNLADSLKNMASSYQFEGSRPYQITAGSRSVSRNFIGSATWSPQSTLVNPAKGDSPLVKSSIYSSYSHLRYPPLVLYTAFDVL